MDTETLRRVQLAQLEIAKEIKRVCDENNIKYFLDSGTLLGAVRHKGFIPWDDDMDIGMLRDEYEKFIRIAPEKLDENYFLQTWKSDENYPHAYAKVRKLGTVYIENVSQNSGAHNELFVDVFPYDAYPDSESDRCGVFDLFHVGHLNLLERCKEMCDILIVGVCDDKYVTEIKKKQPVYPEDQRMRILNALKVVDRAELVTIEETDDKMLALKKFGFDVLFSGDDWKGSERYMRTEKQFAEYGASIEYLPYTHGISTTEIKEKMKEQKV